MAFWGSAFAFDGKPCEEFDLMLYDIEGDEQDEGEFASGGTVVEEVVGKRWKPYFYGVKYERKLEKTIVFGVNQRRVDEGKFLDRYEIDAIAAWLTGHDGYREFTIDQDDMRHVKFKCIVTGLELINYGRVPWAMRATLSCDSPYAYMYPQEYVCALNGNATISLYNRSAHSDYYLPRLEYRPNAGGDLVIANASVGSREFRLTNIPASVAIIYVDNDTQVITCDQGLNLYPYFNLGFLRLTRGVNTLNATGNGELKIVCEFPVNAGG